MARCPSFLWQTDEQTHIWQVVLQGSRDGQKQGPRDRKAEQELREDGPSRRDSGRLGPDSRDAGQRTTTDSKMKRQGGPKRYRQRRRVPSGLFPSRQPGIVLSLGAADPRRAKHTPSPSQPAGQSACLSARRRPPLPARRSRQGLPLLPRAASHLPLPHFLLLSLCQTHLELFKPKYSVPSPSSQIPPQFKTSPALAPGGGEGEERGEGRRRAQEEGEREALRFCLISGEGGRGSAFGHRSISAHFSH